MKTEEIGSAWKKDEEIEINMSSGRLGEGRSERDNPYVPELIVVVLDTLNCFLNPC